MKTRSEYNQIINILQELHKKYPSYNMGRHLSTALSDYNDTWGVTDKEMHFALDKYAAELEMNVIPDDDEFLQQVIEDGETLFDNVLTDDEQEEDY